MSWLGRSPLRQSFSRTTSQPIRTNDCDPQACYDSFCKHWQQIYDIILKVEPRKPPLHDDVLGVVSHLDHMVTLLLVELQNCNKVTLPGMQPPPAPCLEYLLSENLLDKLYEWSTSTGRYKNAVLLEQLKLYELLVSHSRHQLLVHEPFLRPLLKILASCQDEIFQPDIEKKLVILLNQLCVVLMQNVHLLDLFFFSSSQQGNGAANFLIFSLLISYVHRDGTIGHQARDALLLCMSLSQKNANVGTYIAQYSTMCPVLATGLGGLYSALPNSIEITAVDWHRITPDDVIEIPELTLFMNSLEFCNAVVQVAHELIKTQLLDFIYAGFIVPVLGPAILQIFKGTHLQNNADSQISAMAYFDLILRSVTDPGLQNVFVRFLLDTEKFDGQRMLDVLIERISSVDARLCLVTLSLFDTLLSLHSEEIMLELLLKFLMPCKHIPISHRHKVNRIDSYTHSVEFFLELSPEVMKHATTNALNETQQYHSMSKTIGANWNHYGYYGGESLYSNYHAYLFDARHKISNCQRSCQKWSSAYKLENNTTNKRSEKTMELIRSFLNEFSNENGESDKSKQLDSLQSLGESSGYESFKYRPEDDADERGIDMDTSSYGETMRKSESWKVSSRKQEPEIEFDFSEDLFTQGTVTLGPFIGSIWGKLQTFTSNCLFVNLHLTGLITRLAWYPLPLLHSILLRPDIPTTSDTPSFHQLLKILKQQIDAELPITEESLELVDNSRFELIEREQRLVNARKNAIEGAKNGVTSNISSSTPQQLTPSSSYDPFKRGESKRKTFSTLFSNILQRPPNSSATSGLAQLFELFTGAASQISIPLRDTSASSEPTSLDSTHSSSSTVMGSLSSHSTSNGISITNERQRDLALCAVILDEWLKELSAISQEQSLVMLSDPILNCT
ncbi:FHIP family protein [Pseudolycoriella hygida]|uniref:FHIP family protein n=1 Tax=Pseudolycoriella hygida TaxID=35572 RepID=A0A9Q0S657_9DIPT|nr:FHIP family protein [Pseudolycoriella hygida]